VVYSHIDLPIIAIDESLAGSSTLGLVADESVCWITSSEEVEAVKKVVAIVSIDEVVTGCSKTLIGSRRVRPEGG